LGHLRSLPRLLACACLVAVAFIGGMLQNRAVAADLPGAMEYQVTTESGVELNIVPLYLWLPGMSGKVGVFGAAPVNVDLTPIDILSNLGDFLSALDGLYMGTGEVRYGKIGLTYDVFYIDVSSTAEIDRKILKGAADIAFSQVMATVLGSYRVLENDATHVDLLGGIRVNDVRLDVDVNTNLGGFDLSDGSTWVDPMFGAKARMQLNENWYVNGQALLGGFGVSSDFVWDVSAYVGYQWKNWLDFYAGFRGTGTDYKSGSFVWDVTEYGPMIGATFKLN